MEVDRSVEPVEWATPGTKAGFDTLNLFCLKRLRKYHNKSNDPNENALSNLSPWLHFGKCISKNFLDVLYCTYLSLT